MRRESQILGGHELYLEPVQNPSSTMNITQNEHSP